MKGAVQFGTPSLTQEKQMTDLSITPPEPTREQVLLWSAKSLNGDLQFARQAIAWATPIVAQLAADAERMACCKILARTARRPKPLSLKEQALEVIDIIQGDQKMWQLNDLDVVRRALESIPDDFS